MHRRKWSTHKSTWAHPCGFNLVKRIHSDEHMATPWRFGKFFLLNINFLKLSYKTTFKNTNKTTLPQDKIKHTVVNMMEEPDHLRDDKKPVSLVAQLSCIASENKSYSHQRESQCVFISFQNYN